jgi:hypothetical protein
MARCVGIELSSHHIVTVGHFAATGVAPPGTDLAAVAMNAKVFDKAVPIMDPDVIGQSRQYLNPQSQLGPRPIPSIDWANY